MAIEEAILRNVEQGLSPNTLRLWRTTNAIIIGGFQCPKLEVVPSSCFRYKTSVVRRFTGGGAVYQDSGNINFSISMHRDSWRINNIVNIYKKVGLSVVQSLKQLGAPANYNKMSVYVSDRKISGLAGMITKGVLFVHGCLLVSSNLEILHRVLNLNRDASKKRFVLSNVEEVTTLEDHFNMEIKMSEVEKALVEGFKKGFRIDFFLGEFTQRENELAQSLFGKKYSSFKWTFSACEKCPEKKEHHLFLENMAFLPANSHFPIAENSLNASIAVET